MLIKYHVTVTIRDDELIDSDFQEEDTLMIKL